MRRSDWQTLALLGGLTVCFTGMLTRGLWMLIPVACILCVSTCAAKHNHTHCPTFGYHWLNRIMNLWLTVLTGTSTSGIRIAHQVLHHGRNQSPDDFVRCSIVGNLPPGQALWKYVPLVIREVWKTNSAGPIENRGSSLRQACFVERIFLWLAIAAIGAFSGPLALLGIAIPWGFGQWFLIAMNLPQHDGCDAGSQWGHSRNVTGRLANWLFLNNGFHTAHHEKPAGHWSDLPSIHTQEVAVHLPPHLACDSLCGFWLSWWQERRKGVKA